MNVHAKWLPALVVPALLFGIVTTAPSAAASKGVIYSAYWAGYEAVASGSAQFQYVQATFTVPSLNCTHTPTATVGPIVFLGTADLFDNSAGIQESCQNGSAGYEASTDSNCAGHGSVLPLTISPGDDVELSVQDSVVITVKDLTTGQRASQQISCGTDPVAGVVTYGNSNVAVADFTQIGYRQIQAQASSQSSPHPLKYASWSLEEYILRGSIGRVDVKPEALLSGKYTSAFSNDWLAPN